MGEAELEPAEETRRKGGRERSKESLRGRGRGEPGDMMRDKGKGGGAAVARGDAGAEEGTEREDGAEAFALKELSSRVWILHCI